MASGRYGKFCIEGETRRERGGFRKVLGFDKLSVVY